VKRDMDLVIKILDYLEARQESSVIQHLEMPGYDEPVVAYQLRRMYEGGLLDAEAIVSSSTNTRIIDVLPFGLSWQGHEFLDAIRRRGVLEKMRERLGGALTDVPFTILKELALSAVRSQIGL
jgi:hypothetical protein